MSGDCDFNWRTTPEVKIPFGYVQIQGQSIKGDGIYDPALRKFVKVKKQYPFCGGQFPVIIRRAKVEQTEFDIAARIKVAEEATNL